MKQADKKRIFNAKNMEESAVQTTYVKQLPAAVQTLPTVLKPEW
ncbi:hypothetical protein [Thermoleptolyngbya sp. C42_A2020_037]|nr:hypothetical protein [Thermoleptolyngbya sp. C42_A2020_037]